MLKRIYFDNAATTPIKKGVFRAIWGCLSKEYGNPSSSHKEGRTAQKALKTAREQCARALGCSSDELFFTSGAAESNEWAKKIWSIKSDARVHDSLISTGNDVIGVSLINNETGNHDWLDYTEKNKLFIDLTSPNPHKHIKLHGNPNVVGASLSAHKLGALKGVGLLYIKKEEQHKAAPLIRGSQEEGLRGGTENVLGIISMGYVMSIKDNDSFKAAHIANYIKKEVEDLGLKVGGNNHIVNITFNNLRGGTGVLLLDQYGVSVSAGSACNSDSDEPSKILLKAGYTTKEALNTIRVSLGHQNTMREAKKFIKIITYIIDKYDNL